MRSCFQRGFCGLMHKRKQLEHVVTVTTLSSFTTPTQSTRLSHQTHEQCYYAWLSGRASNEEDINVYID